MPADSFAAVLRLAVAATDRLPEIVSAGNADVVANRLEVLAAALTAVRANHDLLSSRELEWTDQVLAVANAARGRLPDCNEAKTLRRLVLKLADGDGRTE